MSKQYLKKNNIRIKDLAEKLNTSASTVSRALNDHPKISQQTKQKVLDMAIQMGYMPNIPSLMAQKDSKLIVLLIPNTSDAYYRALEESIRLFCIKNSFVLFVAETHYDLEQEQVLFQQIAQMKIAGLIYLAHKNTPKLNELQKYTKHDLPIVILHDNHLKEDISSLILDVYQALYKALEHLKSNGAKKIAFLIDDDQHPIYIEMKEHFLSLTHKLEVVSDKSLVFCVKHLGENCSSHLDQLIQNKDQVDAVITSSMKWAYLLQQKMERFSAEKILLVSLNKDDSELFARPKITYLNFQAQKIAEEVVRLLIKQINQDFRVESKVFFSQLITKSSSLQI